MKYLLLPIIALLLSSTSALASRQSENTSFCLVNLNSYRCQNAGTYKDLKDEEAAEKVEQEKSEKNDKEEK